MYTELSSLSDDIIRCGGISDGAVKSPTKICFEVRKRGFIHRARPIDGEAELVRADCAYMPHRHHSTRMRAQNVSYDTTARGQ